MNQDDLRCMRRGKSLSTITAQDIELMQPYARRGKSHHKALLLLHGFSSSPAVFRNLLPHLNQYDAVIVPTLPGHADSLKAFSEVKAQDWLTAVEKECHALCEEYAAVDVLGLSLGGLLACHLSTQCPLNHLYLLAPALDLKLNISVILPLVECFKKLGFSNVRANAGNIYSEDHCEIAYRQLPLTTVFELLTFVQEFSFSAPPCPTDLFLGKYDEVVDSDKVAARFANEKQVKMHWLKHSAHILPLDGDLDQIVACLEKNNP